MKINYRTIRKDFQSNPLLDPVLVDNYAKIISPIFTKLFVELGITPNAVTLLMIYLGIGGSILFLFDSLVLKVFGAFLIHLWYIFDCSDGEVARITKNYSKFGNELDFMSHITTHPILTYAYAKTIVDYYTFDQIFILTTAYSLICGEMVLRHNLSIGIVYDIKSENYKSEKFVLNKNVITMRRLISMLILAVNNFPNLAIIFPLLFFTDLFANTMFAPMYFFLFCAGICITACTTSYEIIRKLFRSN